MITFWDSIVPFGIRIMVLYFAGDFANLLTEL